MKVIIKKQYRAVKGIQYTRVCSFSTVMASELSTVAQKNLLIEEKWQVLKN